MQCSEMNSLSRQAGYLFERLVCFKTKLVPGHHAGELGPEPFWIFHFCFYY